MRLHVSSSTKTIASIFSGFGMIFTPSTSTVRSEIIVESVSSAYEPIKGSIRASTLKAEPDETECTLSNSFKDQVDSGILDCKNGLMCVEDETSSLGGRCVNLDNELATDYNEYEEFVSAETHRQLQLAVCTADDCSTSCTYSDNTPGQKCVGFKACFGIDPANVGCGSCNGYYVCYSGNLDSPIFRSITVGEKSCIGDGACAGSGFSTTATTIGNDSCVGIQSCLWVYVDVGHHACNGYYSCTNVQEPIGQCQCNGDNACDAPSQNQWDKSADLAFINGQCPTPSPTTSPIPPTTPPTPPPTPSPTTKAPVIAAPAGVASGSKWYADWTSSGDETCKNDGNAPEYMVSNAAYWLLEDQQACCTTFFNYKLKDCLGAAYLGTGKYYPDWAGDNKGCVQDSDPNIAPDYMAQLGFWFFETLEECCETHFKWTLPTCNVQGLVGTSKWYVDWQSWKCVQDCVGPTCGGLAEGWDLKYDSKEECCEKSMWWNFNTCMS